MKLTKLHLFIILALALILCPVLGVCYNSNSTINAYNYSEGFRPVSFRAGFSSPEGFENEDEQEEEEQEQSQALNEGFQPGRVRAGFSNLEGFEDEDRQEEEEEQEEAQALNEGFGRNSKGKKEMFSEGWRLFTP